MSVKAILKGKRILVVDDEQDVLDSLMEALEMCIIDTAADFETARGLIDRNVYDAAILDIMGVRGYELLAMTTSKKIPTLILTAHALSPDDLVKSVKGGAKAYVPKEKVPEIDFFLIDLLQPEEKTPGRLGKWFSKLEPFFERTFGPNWKERSDSDLWKK
jgi:CheY-like chemotaxis protein